MRSLIIDRIGPNAFQIRIAAIKPKTNEHGVDEDYEAARDGQSRKGNPDARKSQGT